MRGVQYVVMDKNADLWIMENFVWVEGWLLTRPGAIPRRLPYGQTDDDFFTTCLGEL